MEGDDRPGSATGWTAFAALLAFFWLAALERVLAMSYSISRGDGILVVVLVLTSVVAINAPALIVAWKGRWPTQAPVGLVLGAFGVLMLSQIEVAPLSLLAAMSFLALAAPLLIMAAHRMGNRFAAALSLGVALQFAVRSLLGSLPVYATAPGRIVLAAGGLAIVAAWIFGVRRSSQAGTPGTTNLLAVPPYLTAQALLLAAPVFLARWTARSYEVILLAGIAGAIVGGVLVGWPALRHPRAPALIAAAFLLSVGDLLWFDVAVPVSAFAAQTSATLLVAAALEAPGPPRIFAAVAQWSAALSVSLLIACGLLLRDAVPSFVTSAVWFYLALALLVPLAQQLTESRLAGGRPT